MTTHRPDENADRHSNASDRESGRAETDARQRRSRHRGQDARKERVLHTRISEQLADDIRDFAAHLRVPASNLVRNVLEEVFTIVDSVSDDVGGLMDELIKEAEGVHDRVRRQARSRNSGRTERGRRRSPRGSSTRASDVEEELRRDEAAEASAGDSGTRAGTNPQRPRAAELFPEILGWQPLVLNRDFRCGRCERGLPAGESAFLGVGSTGLTTVALCGKCASSSATN